MKNWKLFIPILLAVVLLAGCQGSGEVPSGTESNLSQPPVVSQPPAASEPPVASQPPAASEPPVVSQPPAVSEPPVASQPPAVNELGYTGQVSMPAEVELESEAVALASSPVALNSLLLPEASGTSVKENSKAIIDYSNSADGYVMVKFTAQTDKKLKVRVTGPNSESPYQYNLTQGEWATFPLSDGNGEYTVKVYENTTGTKYAVVLSLTFTVELKDEFAPFLRPNQYVDYAVAENTLALGAKLLEGVTEPLDKVEVVYDYVIHNLTYDREKADTVKTGYLPVLDDVLAAKKGICFDYAALMTGILRSQGVPCKLMVGYAGPTYHAWINVWSEETGWIEGAVYFDGESWQRLDPTYAANVVNASPEKQAQRMEYIGDGSNYNVKFVY